MQHVVFINAQYFSPDDFKVTALRKKCSSVIKYIFYAKKNNEMPITDDCLRTTTLDPAHALLEACALAAEHSAHLVYLDAPLPISDAVLQPLSAALEKDPLFGMATPRFANSQTDATISLPSYPGEPVTARLSRRALAYLPEQWIVPEFLTSCIVINKRIAANPPILNSYDSLVAALQHLMSSARRRSFRMLVCNRVVLRTELLPRLLYPILPENDQILYTQQHLSSGGYPDTEGKDSKHFREKYPPNDLSAEWFTAHPMHKLEKLCSAAWPTNNDRLRICIDCRGMMAFFCGTTVSQLGFLKGLEAYTDEWEIHVLAQSFALKTHNLRNRFPRLRFVEPPESGYPVPEGEFAAFIHMNQPCYLGILQDIHMHGFITGCNMLDTITWDMIFGCPPEVERVWTFIAQHMDCIFYNSIFSKKQFNRRFPVHNEVLQIPTWHSFTIEDNTQSKFRRLTPEDYLLVFGNNYEHKDVFPTTLRLREMFPEAKIIAFCPQHEQIKNTIFLKSGTLPDEEIERLIACASIIIFPSWIEGFGLPVVKGLAYGRPVVVRSMALWKEIASHCNLPGTLMEFDDAPSLKRVISGILKGHYYNIIEQGKVKKPFDWVKCSGRILEAIKARICQSESHTWLSRNNSLSLINK